MDKSRQAIAVFDRRAADYQSRYMDVGLYHDTLDILCAKLGPSAKILELACGPGNITRYLLDKRNDLKIIGTDLAPNMIALAATNNPEATFELADMRQVARTGGTFDAAVCGFGLPYLSKEEVLDFVADLPEILNPGALVYLSTMEGHYESSGLRQSSDGHDEIFIHMHEARYIVEALQNAGFEIELQKRQPFPDGQDTVDLIVIAKWIQK